MTMNANPALHISAKEDPANDKRAECHLCGGEKTLKDGKLTCDNGCKPCPECGEDMYKWGDGLKCPQGHTLTEEDYL